MTAKSHTTGDVKNAPIKEVAKKGISGLKLHMGTKQAEGSHEAGLLENVQQLSTENP